jgi:hypothetical protein
MANQSRDAERWRERAKEVRAMADHVTYLPAKNELLRVAREYDQLAEKAERASGQNSN